MHVKTVLADHGYGTDVADQALARQGIADQEIRRVGPRRAGGSDIRLVEEASIPGRMRGFGSAISSAAMASAAPASTGFSGKVAGFPFPT